MKTVFIVAVAICGGCIDLEPPTQGGDESTSTTEGGADATTTTAGSSGGETGSGDEGGCTTACSNGHGLSGELMLFVNGRLTSVEGLYQLNDPLDDEGNYVGSTIYLYDPLRTCDDGTSACRVARLGNLRLDDGLGEISVEVDKSLKKFTLRELAWSTVQGLWGISYDAINDEWGIARLDVPDWHVEDNSIGIERWALVPGNPDDPDTDPCYWQDVVSGLAFVGDELLMGVRGLGGVGIADTGWVYRVDLPALLEQGYCVYENDPTQDPHYYACDVLCQPWCSFGAALGVAGDIVESVEGAAAVAIARAESETVMPLDRAALYRCDLPVGEPAIDAVPMDVHVDDIVPGMDIEGLARVGGRLFGIDVLGTVYELDETTRTVTTHDELGPLLADDWVDALRIRGATAVVVPEADG